MLLLRGQRWPWNLSHEAERCDELLYIEAAIHQLPQLLGVRLTRHVFLHQLLQILLVPPSPQENPMMFGASTRPHTKWKLM